MGTNIRECENIVDPFTGFIAAPAHQRGGEEDVIASGIFGMEAGTQFKERADTPVYCDRTA